MKISRCLTARTLPVFCAAFLALPLSSHAQGGTQASQVRGSETQLHDLTDVQRQNNENPEETAAYKAFYSASEPSKKIQLGTAFLKKYPKSLLDEPVEVGLMDAYYSNQDWKNVYATADSALALKPDDVYVLTTVGWLIPHVYDPNDPGAGKLLDTAEQYSKYAIDVIPRMEKPQHTSDAQFAQMKTQSALRAHSALGLVYFRRNDFQDSVKELQQSTPSTPNPDATDLYVLGVDYQNLNRFADAADAYTRCGQIAGPLQDPCKQGADAAKKQSPESK